MKLAPLFAAAAWLARRDLALIIDDIYAIQNTTVALNTAVLNFTGISDVGGLLSATSNTITAIQKATNDTIATGNLTTTDSAGLIPPINTLVKEVRTSIQNTINKKCIFASLNLVGEVEIELQMLLNNTQVFSDTLIANIPVPFQPTAMQFSTPIVASLQQGVDAFAPNGTNSTSTTSGASPSTSCLANGTTVYLSSAGAAHRIGLGLLGSIAVIALIAVAL